jgi:hypothetical protein
MVRSLLLLMLAVSPGAWAQDPAAPVDVPAEDARPGRLTGTVYDPDGLEFPNARVYVEAAGVETRTDSLGRFTLTLPAGTWTLQAGVEGWGVEPAPIVTVPPAGEATIDVTVRPFSDADLMVIDVVAPEVVGGVNDSIEERRESAVVSEVLGNEQMTRSGDSNAAIALTRVTGLTLVDGRFAFVRGLGDRYSSTLINGATLTSPEPERRVVPVDLFPTSFLDSIVVQKTWTPDLPGDFGGGAVVLRTRGIPARRVAGVNLSVGGATGSTFTRTITGFRSPGDAFGVGAPDRRLPSEILEAGENEPLDESDMFSDRGYSAEELEAFGELLPNRWGVGEGLARPDLGVQAFGGRPFDVGDSKVGILAGLTWDSRVRQLEFTRKFTTLGAGGALEESNSYDFVERREDVTLGGLLSLGWEMGDAHEIHATTMLARSSDGEDRQYEGFNRDLGDNIRITRLRWVERQSLVQQVTGRHHLSKWLEPEWRYTFSHATRLEPDQREYRYDEEGTTGRSLLSDRPEGNAIFDSRLLDVAHDGWMALAVPVGTGKVQLGAQLIKRDRGVNTRRYSFQQSGPIAQDQDVLALPPEQIFTPDNIDPDGFQFDETTRQTDNYSATQRLMAGWVLADLALGELTDRPGADAFRLLFGARVERSVQRVETFQLFNPAQVPVVAELDTLDVLPSASLTASFGRMRTKLDGSDDGRPFQVRASYARTVSRPDFRELSPASFNDVTGGRETFGNPDLQRALIDHADVRFEWYPTRGEVVSVGGFYKHFTDPVETVIVVSAQHSRTWANADSAYTAGAELDFRKTGRGLGPFLERTFISGNVAVVASRVKLDEGSGIQTSDERALQGQAPWVVNVQMGWDWAERGHSVWLSYNVAGPSIFEVGALGSPDIYDQSVHRLDLTGQVGLGRGMFLRLRARNLADQAVVRTQGDIELERVREGVSFLGTFGWSL